MEDMKKKLLNAVLADEREYCFDRCYCDDEHWEKFNGKETREEAYQKAKEDFTNKSVAEIMELFGDKYDYVFSK